MNHSARPVVDGKFIAVDGAPFYLRGVTYGPFRPDNGSEYHTPEAVCRDFTLMARGGFNTVRTYTAPPTWLLDIAQEHGLFVMAGLPWEQHIAFLGSPKTQRAIVDRARAAVRPIAGHPALLSITIGNEIPAPIVRWHGRRPVERFLQRLYATVKEVDAGALVTYVNYPTTEYLRLPFVDFTCFNVYLEQQDRLDAYLAWIAAGRHGEMGYMARPDRVARRRDLDVVLPGARSLVVVGLDYATAPLPPHIAADPARGRFSNYAWGADYHEVMTPRLEALGEWLATESRGEGASPPRPLGEGRGAGASPPRPAGEGWGEGQTVRTRVYVDTGALLERDHGETAGLGFTGKNTMLIDPRYGSWFFLGVLLTTLPLDYDAPLSSALSPTLSQGAREAALSPTLSQGERGAALSPTLSQGAVSYTHLRAHETVLDLVCRLLLEKNNIQDT